LIFHLQGSPQVSEKTIDSQKAVDNKIKEKCEEFITYTYDYLTSDIKNFILVLKLPSQEAAASDNIEEPLTQQVEQCKLKLKESIQAFQTKKTSVQKSMSLYMSNPETEAIIFKQIKVSCFHIFSVKTINSFFRQKFKSFMNN